MKRRDILKGMAVTALTLPLRSDASIPRRPRPEPVPIPEGTHAEALFPFKDSDVKFRMEDMMGILRDANHENWRVTAYPDRTNPNIALIGAGFNLSVAKDVEYKPGDPQDPYQYNDRVRRDPSSLALWEAAGLSDEKLKKTFENFARHKKRYGKNNQTAFALFDRVSPDLTDEEATRLLYVSARQGVYNAMAYAKDFDHMTGPQQMGMSQLVYQMGTHLPPWMDEKGDQHTGFQNFLDTINDTSYRQPQAGGAAPDAKAVAQAESEHWKTVQQHLIDSQWFKRYRERAVEVVAQFDPKYDPYKPQIAEGQVTSLAEKMQKEHWHMESPLPGFVDRQNSAPVADSGKRR